MTAKARASRLFSVIVSIPLLWMGGCSLTEPAPPVQEVKGSPAPAYYQNPLLKNAPDPSILKASDGTYYAYPTGGSKFEAYSSRDLVHWNKEGVALSGKELKWASTKFWAPEVIERDGKYYMFFSAAASDGIPKLSVAVSDSPKRPFKHPSEKPLFDFGFGTIDPFIFKDDDGKIFMYFTKTLFDVGDRKESHIYVAELASDLLSVKGEPKLLLKPEQSWEVQSGKMRWNEGSYVLKRNGTYYLMYSANCYCGKAYAVGYATSRQATGPFTKYANNPILSASYKEVSGTGHHSVTTSPDGKEWFIVYHSHIDPAKGGAPRQMNMDRMGFGPDGTLYVNGPTMTKQPMPSGTTDWSNIAAEARVTASSGKKAFPADNIKDGMYAMAVKDGTGEWVTEGETDGAWVMLEWSKAKEISDVLLYDSSEVRRGLMSGKLYVDHDKSPIPVTFPKEPGAAAIVTVDRKKVNTIKLIIDQTLLDGTETGMSEIIVMGK
ncbi:glycoside hydrolase family 43 protein [Paenibacillus allorhizosphaerae]|uniref:DUF7402 domain-containing protein n=1 Tax=Paenibacillus allorhizosphaerae TaxID=2849866 RepID=A0ABM8VMT9_9BACL|nr:glycoside hydrolase family 43 protein [Paenibacillus allorhizosphaerae]CAG7650548.1 hypothetical protein PAECIP111802_04748 [Paenibacillus allorhizosphaerae]